MVKIAIGPQLEGIGSWHWVGEDLAEGLKEDFEFLTFEDQIPSCDALIIIKYKPSIAEVGRLAGKIPVIFCPVDLYGSPAEIDADYDLLRLCQRVIVHCDELRKYFQSYVPTLFLDHHVKFTAPIPRKPRSDGPILWVGMRNNLPPLVEWTQTNDLPGSLVVLTNLEKSEREALTATELGFPEGLEVDIQRWTPSEHTKWLKKARAAIDIKGHDFRQRHKPPAKALDYIASGVPLAMNDSSSRRHLARMGFELPEPTDANRWLSEDYFKETARFGKAVSELLSAKRIAARFRLILQDVLREREYR